MILLKNKDKKANIKIGNNIEIKDGNDFPFDLTLYGKSTQETSTDPVSPSPDYPSEIENVKGKNLLDNKNPNYTMGATWQPTDTGGIYSTSAVSQWLGWNLKLNKDKQYTFSYGARNSKNV